MWLTPLHTGSSWKINLLPSWLIIDPFLEKSRRGLVALW
jgi:hypothetical protein